MAKALEEEDPGATIAEISAGEQGGAFLRSLVKQNDQAVPASLAQRSNEATDTQDED